MTLPPPFTHLRAPRIAVIGAGTMGHGIAYVAALAGCTVTLSDLRPQALDEAVQRIESLLAGGLKRGKLSEDDRAAVHARLRPERILQSAVAAADVVIEAVAEHMLAKQRVFSEVERHAPEAALLATNTSSLSVGSVGGSGSVAPGCSESPS